MLSKVTIENFKAFGEEAVIEIAPIALLFGKNSTGKSTVLHAIGLVDDVLRKLLQIDTSPFSISDRAWDELTYRQLVHNHDIARSIRICAEFQNVDKRLVLELVWDDAEEKFVGLPFMRDQLPPVPFELRIYEADSAAPNITLKCQPDQPAPSVPKRYAPFITGELSRIFHAPTHRELRGDKAIKAIINPEDFSAIVPAPGSALLHNMWKDIRENKTLALLNKALLAVDPRYQLDEQLYITDISKGEDSRIRLPLQSVGSGISTILPVLHLCTARQESNIFLQQPEEEMHPAGQCEIADVMIASSQENNNHLLVETHSEHMLLRILRRIREKTIDFKEYNEKVRVYRIDNGKVDSMTIERDGTFRIVGWPSGFFEERYAESGLS